MTRIAVAAFSHETNQFVAQPTTLADFERSAVEGGVLRGRDLLRLRGSATATGGFLDETLKLGITTVPLLAAAAVPGGRVRGDAFEALLGELLERLRDTLPVDAVFLDLHGAMVTDDHADAEAEICRRIRAVVGAATPLLAAFDLHGNLGESSIEALDAAAAYCTYPHVDMAQTGRHVAQLTARCLSGERPAGALLKPGFLMPTDTQSTDKEPARGLYRRVEAYRARTGIWSASLFAGFFRGDVEFAGPAVLVYADNRILAREAAAELVAEVEAREPSFVSSLTSVADAVAMAKAWDSDRPLLLADVEDNPGGGGSARSTRLLHALREADVRGVAAALFCDPSAVEHCFRAGVDGAVSLALGGGGRDGQPFDLRAGVKALADTPVRLGGSWRGLSIDPGRVARVAGDGIELVVAARREQCLSPEVFRHVGIEPERCRVLVVKSAAHYKADFAPLAGRCVDVAAGGLTTANPARLSYRNLRGDVRLHGGGPTLTELRRNEQPCLAAN